MFCYQPNHFRIFFVLLMLMLCPPLKTLTARWEKRGAVGWPVDFERDVWHWSENSLWANTVEPNFSDCQLRSEWWPRPSCNKWRIPLIYCQYSIIGSIPIQQRLFFLLMPYMRAICGPAGYRSLPPIAANSRRAVLMKIFRKEQFL